MGRHAQIFTEEEFNTIFVFIFAYDSVVDKNAEVENV